MIQRIQSLYLLIVAGLMIATLFAPIAYFFTGTAEYELYSFMLKSRVESISTPYMGLLLLATAILPLVTLFLYKNRMLQIRLCAVNIVLLVGAIIFMAIYYYLSARMFSGLEFQTRGFRIAVIFPLISIILNYLAMRAIFKDEMLVRSLDRIR